MWTVKTMLKKSGSHLADPSRLYKSRHGTYDKISSSRNHISSQNILIAERMACVSVKAVRVLPS